mgnify:CR=1 FL=1
MSKIHKSIAELVGNTPLVELSNYEKKYDIKAHIIGKLEFLNPTGSVKDRLALALIRDGEKKGLIKKGDTLVDAQGRYLQGKARAVFLPHHLKTGERQAHRQAFYTGVRFKTVSCAGLCCQGISSSWMGAT